MKKIIKGFIITLTAAVCLQFCLIFTAAADLSAEDWDIGDSISLNVSPAYADEILTDALSAFDDFGIKAAYIAEKQVRDGNIYLSLLLVANEDTQIDTLVSQLEADVRFTKVRSNAVVNTLHLTFSSDTVKVGETLTIRPEGILNVDDRSYGLSYASVDVLTENYDPEKEYTPADFPQFAFSAVNKTALAGGNAYFTLTLSEPGYCNFYRAINALALDPAILYVRPTPTIIPCVVNKPVWEISDTSVAAFVTSDPIENRERIIKGLQPGTVTVTYIPSLGYHLARDYAVTYEITVTEADTAPVETTESRSGSETTNTESGNTKANPQTGDKGMASLCVLAGAALVGCTAVAVIRYRRRNSL